MYLCQEENLRKNRVSFTSDLDLKPGPVLDTLIQDGILTDNDVQAIITSTTQRERVRKLLSILPTRGPVAYESFRKALKNGDCGHLAEKLPDTTCLPSEDRQFRLHCDDCDDFLNGVQNDVRNKELFKVLQKYCCLFLDNIEAECVTDSLFEAGILNQRNLDTICAKETKYDRCLCMFKLLLSKKSDATLPTLLNALKKKYRFILNAMNQVNQQEISNAIGDCEVHDICQTVNSTDQSACSDLTIANGEYVPMCNAIHNFEVNKYDRQESGGFEVPESASFDEVDSGVTVTCAIILPFGSAETHTFSTALNTETELQPLCLKDVAVCMKDEEPFQAYEVDSSSTACSYMDNAKVKQKGHNTVADDISEDGHILYKQVTMVPPSKLHQHDISEDGHIVYKQVTMVPPSKLHQLQTNSTFTLLSSLINEGKIDTFKKMSLTFSDQFSQDYDIRFILGYLHARADLFANDFESSKEHVKATMQIAKKSSNPHLFTLELLNSESRIYLGQKQLQKLRNLLDELLAQAKSNYLECRGRLAGWLFLNDARCTTAQMCQIDIRRKHALTYYNDLYERARESFFRSMDNFTFEKNECGLEGDLGLAYAACRFVILLMRCGDNGLTMDVKELEPPDIDIIAAEKYVNLLETTDTSLPPIIQIQVCLGKCDLYFRKHDLHMAYSMAFKAQEIAKDKQIREFDEHTRNRISLINKLCHSRNISTVRT